MQFFWNIQRKANYARAMQELEISHLMFVMMTQSIIGYSLNAGVFRTPSSM